MCPDTQLKARAGSAYTCDCDGEVSMKLYYLCYTTLLQYTVIAQAMQDNTSTDSSDNAVIT